MSVDRALRVVMPVHNAATFVEEALKSTLQDLGELGELLVVDDGSTDGTGDICRAIAAGDDRVTVITNNPGVGVSGAINAGVMAPGCPEFVAIAEHDDVVLPGRFAAQLSVLTMDKRLGAVASEGAYVGPSGRRFGRVSAGPRDHQQFERMRASGEEILIPHPCVTYRRQALVASGLYDPDFDGAQDLELMNRMVYEHGWELRCLPVKHVLYRLHDSATSFAGLTRQRMITRYVRHRNKLALSGLRSESFADWCGSNTPALRTRLRWYRHDKGALNFRRAGLAWLEQNYLRFVARMLAAVVLHPQWVLQKLTKLAGR